jgi:hypothetical protein
MEPSNAQNHEMTRMFHPRGLAKGGKKIVSLNLPHYRFLAMLAQAGLPEG